MMEVEAGREKDRESASLKVSVSREMQIDRLRACQTGRASALCLQAGELTSSEITFFTCKMRICILTSCGMRITLKNARNIHGGNGSCHKKEQLGKGFTWRCYMKFPQVPI